MKTTINWYMVLGGGVGLLLCGSAWAAAFALTTSAIGG